MNQRVSALIAILFSLTATSFAAGVGVNVPLVGRLIGGGNTLYITAIDVANHADQAVVVDFYLDGQSAGQTVVLNGSLRADGQPVPFGSGSAIRARTNIHFDDFVDALVQAGLLPAGARDHFVGSTLFVFNGIADSGRGAVTARFYNRYGDGFVGVALKGREITSREPQALVAAVRDTRSAAGTSPLYPNLFINNIGLTPAGTGGAGPVTVEIRATGNRSGQPVGVPVTVELGPGQTASISQVLNVLQVPLSEEDTIVIVARVIEGNAAIHGLVSQVEPVTRDGSVFEMSRFD